MCKGKCTLTPCQSLAASPFPVFRYKCRLETEIPNTRIYRSVVRGVLVCVLLLGFSRYENHPSIHLSTKISTAAERGKQTNPLHDYYYCTAVLLLWWVLKSGEPLCVGGFPGSQRRRCKAMGPKDAGVFLTQTGTRRAGQVEDAVDADQLEEMVAGVAQTSQSTLLLKKKKEMREVRMVLCGSCEGLFICRRSRA